MFGGSAWRLIIGVQYNGGLLPDIILLTQCYHHRGTPMKRFGFAVSSVLLCLVALHGD